MRLAVAATPSVAIPTLNYLLESGHSLIRIFTTSDKAVGRGRNMKASDVAMWAQEHGIECVKVSGATDLETQLTDIDCVVTIAFGILLPQSVLSIPKFGFINLHFSLLPAWRGAAPVQRAIEMGDANLGITVFKLEAGMDTGPIYLQRSFKRDPDMRSKEALEFLGVEGVSLIASTLSDIQNGVSPTTQSDVGISLAKKLTKDEARIDWSASADVIHRKISAFYPNPIAFTHLRNEVLKITRSQLSDDFPHIAASEPGELIVEKNAVFISTGDKPLQIVQLIPQGKTEMKASDWARGARINPGERCG